MTRQPFTRGRRHHRSAISPYFFAPPSSTYRPPQTKPPCDEDRGQTTSTYPTSISPSYSTCPKNAPMTMDRKRNVLYVMATSMSWSQIQLEGPCNPTETHPEGDANAQGVQACSKDPHAKRELRPVISYCLCSMSLPSPYTFATVRSQQGGKESRAECSQRQKRATHMPIRPAPVSIAEYPA